MGRLCDDRARGDAAAAQKTGDQATLVFTVSGGYIQGKRLWAVEQQPIQDGAFTDFYNLNRNIKSTLAASMSATYYPGTHLGLTAEAYLVGMGYDDGCTLAAPAQSLRSTEVCSDIDKQDKSAAAVAISTGGIFRIAPANSSRRLCGRASACCSPTRARC